MKTCRILVDAEPHSGPWNMAVDEALLESAAESHHCTVRWYRWQEATVSLGHFQQRRDLETVPALAALPCVRRLSGGGAIVHHHELTYSCTVPASHPLAPSRDVLYECIHERIIRVLREEGFEVESRGSAAAKGEAQTDALLCFDRHDARDVLLSGRKILGSAQRRRRGAVLQHGSLLLRTSPHAPQFPGLLNLAGRRALHRAGTACTEPASQAAHALEMRWMKLLAVGIGSAFCETVQDAPLAPHEVQRASGLRAQYQGVGNREFHHSRFPTPDSLH